MENSSTTERFQPLTSVESGKCTPVVADITCCTIQIANVVFYGMRREGSDWVLIDAGMPKSGPLIKELAETHFGEHNPPKAILLTHAHFDHVGGLIQLLEKWDVPVYAHPLELPHLQGEQDYPRPDPTVEGGAVAKLSALFPTEAIDIGERAQALPDDGSVPFMDGWKWIATPGHSDGHISLYREGDGALIVGDAFVTVRQDALYKVLTQDLELNGPPRYLTTDWKAAEQSVRRLNDLKPAYAITGHGKPAEGEWLREHLQELTDQFQELAVPAHGKFVDEGDK